MLSNFLHKNFAACLEPKFQLSTVRSPKKLAYGCFYMSPIPLKEIKFTKNIPNGRFEEAGAGGDLLEGSSERHSSAPLLAYRPPCSAALTDAAPGGEQRSPGTGRRRATELRRGTPKISLPAGDLHSADSSPTIPRCFLR